MFRTAPRPRPDTADRGAPAVPLVVPPPRRRRRAGAVAGLTAVSLAVAGAAVASAGFTAGPQGDGTSITPTGWHVTPVGRQVTVGERPYGLALSPDGRYALVSNDGVARQSVQLVDVASGKVTSTIEYPAPEAVYLGIAWASDGSRVYVAGGANDVVRVYDVADGSLTEKAPLTLSTKGTGTTSFAAGLALSKDDRTLYVADHLANALSVVDVATGAETRVPLSGTACTLNAFGSDPSNGTACEFAYAVALSPDGRTAYVSSWGKDYVTSVDTTTRTVTRRIRTGVHPSAMVVNARRAELYVANTDADSVSVISTRTGGVVRTFSLSPFAGARPGTQPNALAVSPDGGTLYVANAGNNDVDVVRLGSGDGRGSRHDEVRGLIPTGWYPAGVAATPDGRRILVANAKGLGAGPNATGPNNENDYIGSMIKGTVSIVPTPGRKILDRYTRMVQANGGFVALEQAKTLDKQHVVPVSGTKGSSKIKHVIYVVNENRTFDQVLGDLGRGNGDPSITLFPRPTTPNHHALAEKFTTLDNLYAAGEVSDDGWEWTTGANASTLTVKTQPTLYGGRGHFYIGEGGSLGAAPGTDPNNAYIWDRVGAKGLTYRNYGFWATDTPPVDVYNEPELLKNTDRSYAGFNMGISDQTRFAEWHKEFTAFEKSGEMPSMQFIKFPRDHTSGTSPGAPTPTAMVADSDWAVGRLVDAVSHSKFWKDTAIFVVEDDAQDGPDHVDAHRTLAHVISPYTQTGAVDSTFYSSVSMLRTMELILGLDPMSQFDAASTPLVNSFTDRPDFTPYDALQPSVDLDAVNPANAPLAAESAAMNFTSQDKAPTGLLNKAIWQSVRGAGSPMPAPKH